MGKREKRERENENEKVIRILFEVQQNEEQEAVPVELH